MFGNKLRSWMEAVRPRKKQQKKEKQNKNMNNTNLANPNWQNPPLMHNAISNVTNTSKKMPDVPPKTHSGQTPATSRYSANNLSSPESAYSTGYSTDGTSPGAPPDYYVNIRTGVRYFSTETEPHLQRVPNGKTEVHKPSQPSVICAPACTPKIAVAPPIVSQKPPEKTQSTRAVPCRTSSLVPQSRLNEVMPSPVLTSPRQRNRIRTNPWLPGSTLSPGQIRQEVARVTKLVPVTDSPKQRRFLSPSTLRNNNLRKQSLSSSSCSSLSGASVHWERKKPGSGSEDDCTLNEMMGKYDESYVYEKETDILTDSDPTDCDTDIDTGQDGGDEDDPCEGEFDFIDNGSYLEVDFREDRNTGHCTYYNFEGQRRVSRRRTTRRSKQSSEKRRRSSSNKKRHKPERSNSTPMNGSKSAGATPLSVRRTKHPVSKLAVEECLKKRSNSISFSRDPLSAIDRRDKEADKKYKELIVEAEHILRSMKMNNGLISPRRVPGPANKRVEILRSAECTKPELLMKNRLIEEPQYVKPSNNFSCPRFSPKRNHITNFMINNSPVLMRRDNDLLPASPLAAVKNPPFHFHKNRNEANRAKYRSKANKNKMQECSSSSSEGEAVGKMKVASHVSKADSLNFGCPQSEPVRRKVYLGRGKTVAFNLNYDTPCHNHSPPYSPTHKQEYKSSAENLRQQVLLSTIANLKRSLEDQSASLKQVYKSSQNIQI